MSKIRQISQKLAIGSAQFGLDYGVSNHSGKVPISEQKQILARAREAGILLLDTAKSYGDAESALGAYRGFSYVSKIAGLEERKIVDARTVILSEVEDSLKKLGVEQLHGLMLHREKDLLGPRGKEIWAAMQELKARGWVRKVGVSSHNPLDLERVSSAFPIEIAQVPVNALDQRFLPLLERCPEVEFHARSLFLQGFFFFRPESLPPFLGFARKESEAIWRLSDSLGVTPAHLSFSFACAQTKISHFVFAVTKLSELDEILGWPLIDIPESAVLELQNEAKRSAGRLQDPLLWGMPPR